MTPAARVAAAIAVLDRIIAGEGAERALTAWGRASRFAGSGDRAAVRDHVYDALRRRRSAAAAGGSDTGRGLMLGLLRQAGQDPAALFTGEGHAPPPPGPDEAPVPAGPLDALDCPDWLAPKLAASLGPDFAAVMEALRHRAPVFLRANLGRTTRAAAQAALAAEGIETAPHPLATSALEVTANARRIQQSRAYAAGLVELQDAASQAVVEVLPLADGMRVLDYCAGGGGKALAMAACARLEIVAHDAEPRRMRDLPERARRAGVAIATAAHPEGPFDLILADAPCSGSGSWRRDPEGKWALTPDRLAALRTTQAEVLDRIAALAGPGTVLAYATCSLLAAENESQVAAFLGRHPDWHERLSRRWTPLEGGDGFYVSLLSRNLLQVAQLAGEEATRLMAG